MEATDMTLVPQVGFVARPVSLINCSLPCPENLHMGFMALKKNASFKTNKQRTQYVLQEWLELAED